MFDNQDLIPVRALNQVTYCNRLYYLEYVESLMPINEHVEDGIFQHRRVDDPDLQNRPRKDGAVVHTRSVQLSSERLGITGKLDVVEEKDGRTYPVEYKRGNGPGGESGRPEFWENDGVQLCAQAMLLEEERGITIPSAILYYMGSKTRVDVPMDDDLRTRTLQAIRVIRELSLRDTPPTPLPPELRHRCFGCSLVTICQPEETLYCLDQPQLAPINEPAVGITRVLPQGSEGAVLYLQEQGAHVGKRSEHLIVRKHGHELQRIPIAAVRQVVVLGNVQISTQALGSLASLGVPVAYMTAYGTFVASVMPTVTKNVLLRVNQFKIFADPQRALNALLSFAYAMLLKDCFSALCAVGFDPYHGFFHVGRHGKPSLALDLMEEFRAIIADSVVLTLINNETLTSKDFLSWRESCQLTEEGRKRFFETYEHRKSTVVTHPVFGYKMSYGRMLEVQARMLAAHIRGDIPEYTGFTVR